MGEMANIGAGSSAEHRAARRTNLMLAATIAAEGRILPVRIRNVSETGALVEGAALPDKGVTLELTRGNLRVPATVAWSGGGRCGIHFDRPTPVNEWTGGKPKPLDPTGLRDQRRVDAIQAEARVGVGAAAPSRPPASPGSSDEARDHLRARLADELAYVQRLLESMGDDLVTEPIVVAHHSRTLQNMDVASQILAHLASVVIAEDPVAAVERIGMQDLRARLKRKPLL
jgi:hypothetical protein